MAVIKRSMDVRYTSRQMFELVDNIEKYPEFLPWCSTSRVLLRDHNTVEAELVIAWSGIHKSFATRNQLTPYERIDITLIQGPFRHLEGIWNFIDIGNHCRVTLELEFEFTGSLLDILFQPIFNHIANSLVDLFCQRAHVIYGKHDENSS